jgi:hypothetical protein
VADVVAQRLYAEPCLMVAGVWSGSPCPDEESRSSPGERQHRSAFRGLRCAGRRAWIARNRDLLGVPAMLGVVRPLIVAGVTRRAPLDALVGQVAAGWRQPWRWRRRWPSAFALLVARQSLCGGAPHKTALGVSSPASLPTRRSICQIFNREIDHGLWCNLYRPGHQRVLVAFARSWCRRRARQARKERRC